MGLGTMNRRGWEKDPLGQGRFNLFSAIVVIAVFVPLVLIFDKDGSVDLVLICAVFLSWGIISYLLGRLMDKLRKNTKDRN